MKKIFYISSDKIHQKTKSDFVYNPLSSETKKGKKKKGQKKKQYCDIFRTGFALVKNLSKLFYFMKKHNITEILVIHLLYLRRTLCKGTFSKVLEWLFDFRIFRHITSKYKVLWHRSPQMKTQTILLHCMEI